MLFANWIDVPDAMAFLDAFAEAAQITRGWKLDRIKTDFGHQFVYVRYTGRKFAGQGLMASAFVPIHQYRDCKGAVLAHVDAPPTRTPSASDGRYQYRDHQGAVLANVNAPNSSAQPRMGRKLVAGGASPRNSRAPISKPQRGERLHNHPCLRELQRVNITLRADEWPTHICFDEVATSLLAPLLKKVRKSILELRVA